MKAVYYEKYGPADVLQFGEIEKPKAGEGQILVKVHATSVNPVDWKIRNDDLKLVTGFRFSKIPGRDIAGEVVEVGPAVQGFKPGDKVYAMADTVEGGSYAEYVSLPVGVAAPMPQSLDYNAAAAVPLAALTALQGLRDKGDLEKGEKVLINGASGGVGSFAVQLAKILGSSEVTATCGPEHLELVHSLGADRVINYKEEDFTKEKNRYDLIFDAIAKHAYSESKDSLRENGRYVTTVPEPTDTLKGWLTSVFSDKKMKVLMTHNSAADLNYLRQLIDNGQLRPIVDRSFPLAQAAEAHRYSEEGHSAGKVVIQVRE